MSLEDEYAAAEQVQWQGRFIVAKTRGRWEYVSRTRNIGAAIILAIDQGDVILVEQFRIPLGRRSLELPAGLVGDEPGHEDEPTVIAAARELEEETGYRAGVMEEIGEFQSSPGIVTEAFTLFRASELTQVSPGGGVAGEDITVHRVALAQIEPFIASKRAEGCAIDTRMLLFLAARLIPV